MNFFNETSSSGATFRFTERLDNGNTSEKELLTLKRPVLRMKLKDIHFLETPLTFTLIPFDNDFWYLYHWLKHLYLKNVCLQLVFSSSLITLCRNSSKLFKEMGNFFIISALCISKTNRVQTYPHKTLILIK